MKWYLFGGLIAFAAGIVGLTRSNDALGIFYGFIFVFLGAAAITIFFMDSKQCNSKNKSSEGT